MNNLLKGLIFYCFLFMLMGCKAEIIETKIKTEKLKIAISQKFTTIPFKAKITLMGDEKDTRQQMETFQNILEKYIEVEDLEISKSMMGMDLVIEGNIPLVFGDKLPKGRQDPWALFVKKNERKVLATQFPFVLTLRPTRSFGGFKNEFSEKNILLVPDPYQPIVFKFRNNDGSILKIFSGGVEVAGKHFAVFEGSADKRLSIRLKGGVYDHVNPLLFFRLE